MKFFHGSIRKKLVALVFVATLPVFLVLLGTEFRSSQQQLAFAKKDTALYLNGFAELQNRITNSTETLLRTVASMPAIRNMDEEQSRIVLSTLLETNPIYTNVILVNNSGDVIAAGKNNDKTKSFNFGDRKQFLDAISKREFSSGEFAIGKSSQKPIFPFGMPVLNEYGASAGALIIGVSLAHYGKLFEEGNYPQDTFIGLCDHNGTRLFRHPASKKTPIGLSIKPDVFQTALDKGEKGSIHTKSSDGRERVILFEPIRLKEGASPYIYMFMGFDYQLLKAEGQAILYRLLIISFLSLTLALGIAWFLGNKSIAGRIGKLSRVTTRFSRGEKEVSSDIDYKDGEIGELARAFDNMVTIIRQREDERNDALKRLGTSEQRFRELIEDVSAIAICSFNEQRIVTFWNPASEELYGYTKEEAIGASIDDLIVPKDQQREQKILQTRWLEEGVRIPSREMLMTSKSGENVSVFSSHVMQVTEAGREIFNMDIDLTPIKAAEKEKSELLSQLNQAQKMDAIGQLAGGIAHDFNNMLGGILGASELLSFHLPDEPKARQLQQIIVQSANRAANLTSKLLTFSRSSNKASSAVDLHEIIAESATILENTIDRRITVEVDFGAENSRVVGDHAQLQSVILNLGINGSHAMPNGGNLSISTRNTELDEMFCELSTFDLNPGPYIEIEVRDTGTGIPKENLTKIFEPFFTTKDPDKGTGLGLAAAYGSIKQHDGAISVYSESGSATTFNILLPLTDTEHQVSPKGKTLQKGEGTILVVDDEEVMRITAKAILEDLGYEVVLAENGERALNIYQQDPERFSLVLLDMIMPVMNGKDCFIALKTVNPAVRVILSSGFTREQDLKEMKERGLNSFIRKPYRSILLSEAVYEALQ
ncbi:response regulator [Desulfopila sp. IMCC35008]|uniref:response regulator n=1 Tax=Desulfopila sp. IMCC35008 TaxID=2653858 RepID=UPI0013D38016|nr:response regulator [Desulfopila sp. IMCC35008]